MFVFFFSHTLELLKKILGNRVYRTHFDNYLRTKLKAGVAELQFHNDVADFEKQKSTQNAALRARLVMEKYFFSPSNSGIEGELQWNEKTKSETIESFEKNYIIGQVPKTLFEKAKQEVLTKLEQHVNSFQNSKEYLAMKASTLASSNQF